MKRKRKEKKQKPVSQSVVLVLSSHSPLLRQEWGVGSRNGESEVGEVRSGRAGIGWPGVGEGRSRDSGVGKVLMSTETVIPTHLLMFRPSGAHPHGLEKTFPQQIMNVSNFPHEIGMKQKWRWILESSGKAITRTIT